MPWSFSEQAPARPASQGSETQARIAAERLRAAKKSLRSKNAEEKKLRARLQEAEQRARLKNIEAKQAEIDKQQEQRERRMSKDRERLD